MTRKGYTFFLFLVFLPAFSFAQQKDSLKSIYDYSLIDLSEIKIITGAIKKAPRNSVPANVIIITKQMIEERGYRTLVDVCEDIPSFDFMTYNDGGAEYPGFSKNRGLGIVGNPEILVMIDGVVQNNISFNWSLLWTYENMFIDIQQIEIIEGPGSVMYGAQAFTGVINLITEKKFKGLKLNSAYGLYNTLKNDLYLGVQTKKRIHFSLTLHQYHSDGDMGLNRYDPGGYFSNNPYPDTLLADYDKNGNFVRNIPNPLAGKIIPAGFNTLDNSYAIRAKFSCKNTKLGFFYTEYKRGGGSYLVPYEYNLTDKQYLGHFRDMNIFLINNKTMGSKLSLQSNWVFRTTDILPHTGFKYLYRFPRLNKSYTAYAYHSAIEEKFLYEYSKKNTFYFGVKAGINRKTDRIVSLGIYNRSHTGTSSSWNIAKVGKGLYQSEEYPVFYEKATAAYALWDKEWLRFLHSSMGLRYDYSSDFGSVLNPRLSLVYKRKPSLGMKFLFGTAFRQAGIFELYSEFRGNPHLKPERIQTSEFELSSLLWHNRISLKANVFYSKIKQYIGKVPDSTMPAGERYENLNEIDITGAAIYFSSQLVKNIRLYSNYGYIIGFNNQKKTFYKVNGVAKNKANMGINAKFLENKFLADLRFNFVGKRKAPPTNIWMQRYQNGYAPSYLKANLSLLYNFWKKFSFQLLVDNLFDTKYYGLGRENGSGFIDSYDPLTNPNPKGFIPAYHPQEGRSFIVNLTYRL